MDQKVYKIYKKKLTEVKLRYKLKECGRDTDTYDFLLGKKLFGEDQQNKELEYEAVDRKNKTIFDEDVVKGRLEEAVEYKEKKKSKKSIILNLVLLAINITIVCFIASSLIKNADDASISSLLNTQGDRLNYLFIGVGLFILLFALDSLCVSVILKQTTGKYKYLLSYKTSAIGKYYDSVTPLAFGGQPAQIVELTKGGVTPGVATTIPIIKMTIVNFVAIILSVIFFITVGPNVVFDNTFNNVMLSILKIIAYIGAIINILYFLFMFFMATSKNIGRSLGKILIKIGYSLKIVKNYRKSYDKFMRQVYEFQDSVNYLKSNIWFLLKTVFITGLESLIEATIPFVVCLALTDISFATFSAGFSFWAVCALKYYMCYMASSFIPLPGGTGMNEIAFIVLFGPVIGSNFIVWGFLLWRLLTYYMTILQGIVHIIIKTIYMTAKKEKNITNVKMTK